MNRELILTTLFNRLTASPLVFQFTANTTTGSQTLSAVSDTSGLMIGMPVAGDGLAADTTITAIAPIVTVSLPAIADRTASAMTQGFQTARRRPIYPRDDQSMPTLALVEISELHEPRGTNQPAFVDMHCECWIYTKVGADPDAIPASTLNMLIDGIEAALYPTPTGFRQDLGLEGVVWARIEGEISKDPGHNDQLAGAIVPIRVRVAQSADTVSSPFMTRRF